ncbi:MAG: RNA polymerase sigma factor [Marinilabiliaceae bacterium]|nr:RNA polymerase sigma factor [Marinilabiliaceae bacterium]
MPVLNEYSFKKLFDKYFDALRNYIYYRCGDSELATDITQETFMKIWEKKIDVFEKKEMGLLIKIANDLFISAHRRIKYGQNFRNAIKLENVDTTPEDEMTYKEINNKYEHALSELNEKQRIVFLLNRVDGLKYSEIAQNLGISVKAVEKRMSLALDYFRKMLL